jgi:hypothetical protein
MRDRWVWTDGDGWLWAGYGDDERQGTAYVIESKTPPSKPILDAHGREVTIAPARPPLGFKLR